MKAHHILLVFLIGAATLASACQSNRPPSRKPNTKTPAARHPPAKPAATAAPPAQTPAPETEEQKLQNAVTDAGKKVEETKAAQAKAVQAVTDATTALMGLETKEMKLKEKETAGTATDDEKKELAELTTTKIPEAKTAKMKAEGEKDNADKAVMEAEKKEGEAKAALVALKKKEADLKEKTAAVENADKDLKEKEAVAKKADETLADKVAALKVHTDRKEVLEKLGTGASTEEKNELTAIEALIMTATTAKNDAETAKGTADNDVKTAVAAKEKAVKELDDLKKNP